MSALENTLVSRGSSRCTAKDQKDERKPVDFEIPPGSVQHLHPEGLHRNPVYTDVITATGNVKTVYIGAQGAFDSEGHLVGEGDLEAQTLQALHRIDLALAAAGAAREHLVKVNVYIIQGQSVQKAFAAFQRAWGILPNPPTNTVMMVPALVPEAFLVAIDALAVVPLQGEH